MKEPTWELSKIVDKDGTLIGTRGLGLNAKKEKEKPFLVYFTVPFESRPMPNSDEMDRLLKIEERLWELEDELSFIHVGTMMLNGVRDWILYATDGQSLMAALLSEFGEHRPTMECVRDPRWSQYRDLKKM